MPLFTNDFRIRVFERGLAIISYIFPIIEISYSFGPKVFSGTESVALTYIYINYISKLNAIYQGNVYFIFAIMVGIFIICSRGTLKLTRFVRYNVIQAILLNIICSCIGASFGYFPVAIRETIFGNLIANCVFLGTMGLIIYASTLIFFGQDCKIPSLKQQLTLPMVRI